MGRSSQRRIARRLEELREESGFASLRAFHEAVVERTEETFSYTAVRNYHDDDPEKGRTPPVDYLDAISRVFGVRLGWLVRGEEPMHATGEAGHRWLREGVGRLEEAFPTIRMWPTWVRERLFELTARGGYGTDAAAALVELISAPLEAEGLRSLEVLTTGEEEGYFGAMLGALSILVTRKPPSDEERKRLEEEGLGFEVESLYPDPQEED